jgi:hypothetical protein
MEMNHGPSAVIHSRLGRRDFRPHEVHHAAERRRPRLTPRLRPVLGRAGGGVLGQAAKLGVEGGVEGGGVQLHLPRASKVTPRVFPAEWPQHDGPPQRRAVWRVRVWVCAGHRGVAQQPWRTSGANSEHDAKERSSEHDAKERSSEHDAKERSSEHDAKERSSEHDATAPLTQ